MGQSVVLEIVVEAGARHWSLPHGVMTPGHGFDYSACCGDSDRVPRADLRSDVKPRGVRRTGLRRPNPAVASTAPLPEGPT